MKFYVPELSDKIILTESWTFQLHSESRNTDFAKRCFKSEWSYHWGYPTYRHCWIKSKYVYENDSSKIPANAIKSVLDVTLPVGTVLSVDRIYIRKGCKNYSSITFRALKAAGNPIFGRFWVKLADANRIVFEPVLDENSI